MTQQPAPLGRENVDAILFDFDGVLTDNRVIVFDDGREAVICNRADGLAFDWFREAQLPVFIVSTERNPVVSARAGKLGVPVRQGVGDKSAALHEICEENGFDAARIIFVGNDVNDLPAMQAAGYAVAVADAAPAVRKAAAFILETPGGGGVAREVHALIFGDA